MAFVSSAAAEPNRRFVVVLPDDGGQAREFLIPTTSGLNQDLRWFGDGRGLGLSGFDTRGAPAVFRLLLETGEWKTIPLAERAFLTRTEWNHDGSAFYLGRPTPGKNESDGGIVERAVNGDAERLVYRSAGGGGIQALQFSPDRKWLAFTESRYDGNPGTIGIVVADVGTGETRPVLVEKRTDSNNELSEVHLISWTPSGDLLVHKLYGSLVQKLAGNGRSETLLVPLNGSPSRPFAIPSIGTTGRTQTSRQIVAKWSPDGRTMVVGRAGRGGETYIIENPLAGVRAQTTGRR
jgi:Tol biopolymer transport system component